MVRKLSCIYFPEIAEPSNPLDIDVPSQLADDPNPPTQDLNLSADVVVWDESDAPASTNQLGSSRAGPSKPKASRKRKIALNSPSKIVKKSLETLSRLDQSSDDHFSRQNDVLNQLKSQLSDRYFILGSHIAAELRSVSDEQFLISQLMIHQIVYQAQRGELNHTKAMNLFQ